MHTMVSDGFGRGLRCVYAVHRILSPSSPPLGFKEEKSLTPQDYNKPRTLVNSIRTLGVKNPLVFNLVLKSKFCDSSLAEFLPFE